MSPDLDRVFHPADALEHGDRRALVAVDDFLAIFLDGQVHPDMRVGPLDLLDHALLRLTDFVASNIAKEWWAKRQRQTSEATSSEAASNAGCATSQRSLLFSQMYSSKRLPGGIGT